jgi:hypothetical protein
MKRIILVSIAMFFVIGVSLGASITTYLDPCRDSVRKVHIVAEMPLTLTAHGNALVHDKDGGTHCRTPVPHLVAIQAKRCEAPSAGGQSQRFNISLAARMDGTGPGPLRTPPRS